MSPIDDVSSGTNARESLKLDASDLRRAAGRTRRRGARVALLMFVLPAMGLPAAGCGGGSSPSVASLATTAPTATGATSAPTSASSATSAVGPSAGVGGSVSGGTMRVAGGGNLTAFSSCMRSHGVPSFPDPNGQGVITFSSADGVDPNSAQFQKAQQACQKLMPNRGAPTPAQQQQMQTQMLEYSACMRSHGVPGFPDPSFSGGHASLSIQSGSGIDPDSPQFQAAQRACQKNLPGLPGAAAAGARGGGLSLKSAGSSSGGA